MALRHYYIPSNEDRQKMPLEVERSIQFDELIGDKESVLITIQNGDSYYDVIANLDELNHAIELFNQIRKEK